MKQNARPRDARIRRGRRLRRDVTGAEHKLWWHLRRLSVAKSHFRRQATIGPYVADFACYEARIVIEVDGGQHNEAAHAATDAARTAYLNAQGYRVLRFWNNDVLENVDGVLETIDQALKVTEPPTLTPPHRKRGEGNRSR